MGKDKPTSGAFSCPLPTLPAVAFYQFNQLPYEAQFASALNDGTFLSTRWQAENEAVNLYAMPRRFFVELIYDTAANELLGLRSFSNSEGLEDCAASVRLPDWLSG